MSDIVFKNLKVNGVITDIVCRDGVIAKIGKTEQSGIDFGGKKVYPGLIDIHTHGIGGIDTMDAQPEKFTMLYAQNGTTSILPTTMTCTHEAIKAVLECPVPKNGANILGYHLEGPYINEKHIGAQNSECVRKPDINEFKCYDNIKMVTLAPEVDGAEEYIKQSKSVISIGHTDADYDETVKAAHAGARCLTHTFNAMPPLHHRNPGVVGAGFDENMYAQVICDGKHIHGSVIRILYKLFGAERMILISDSIRATGLPDGEYELGGQMMIVKNGTARTSGGALAGSTSTLLECVKKAIEFGIPEKDAFRMASQTPAELIGVKKGIIKEGYDCDLIIVDENNELCDVIIGGKLIREGK